PGRESVPARRAPGAARQGRRPAREQEKSAGAVRRVSESAAGLLEAGLRLPGLRQAGLREAGPPAQARRPGYRAPARRSHERARARRSARSRSGSGPGAARSAPVRRAQPRARPRRSRSSRPGSGQWDASALDCYRQERRGTKGSRLATSEATGGFVLDERRLVGVVRGPRAVEALLPGIRTRRFVRGWKHANVPRRLRLGACVVVLAPVPPTTRCGRTAV